MSDSLFFNILNNVAMWLFSKGLLSLYLVASFEWEFISNKFVLAVWFISCNNPEITKENY